MEALIDWANRPDNPIEKLELAVVSENHHAIELYKKLGFQEEGLVKKAIKVRDGTYLDQIETGLFLNAKPSKV